MKPLQLSPEKIQVLSHDRIQPKYLYVNEIKSDMSEK